MLKRLFNPVAAGAAILMLVAAGCGSSAKTVSAGAGSGGAATTGTITTGSIATVTGPVPGLFQGAPFGVDAYYAYVNSTGGVNGKKLQNDSKDDAFNCSQNETAAKSLAGSVFAMVGSFSVLDQCTLPVAKTHPDQPYVGVQLNSALAALPNAFSPEPTPPGYRSGAMAYIKQHYGVSTMGVLAASGSAQATEQYEIDAAKSIGAKIAYSRFVGSTETDFTSDVVRMRQAGVDWVFLNPSTENVTAIFLQDAKQQNFHPKVIESGTAYDGHFLGLLQDPSLADGLLIDQSFVRYLGEDAATTPEVATFTTWLAKVHPSFKPDLYSLYGWTSAMLFVQALKAAGPGATPAAVVKALSTVHSFTGNGLISQDDPGAKVASSCWLLLQVESGKFNRVMPADKGFSCDPDSYYTP